MGYIEDDWRLKTELIGDIRDWNYLEWKYFSFEGRKVKGFIAFTIGNPSNILGLKKHIIAYGFYFGKQKKIGTIVPKNNEVDLSDKEKWILGNCCIENQANKKILKGEVDGIKWELNYDCRAEGKRHRLLESKKKDWMDWEVFCNLAKVEGWLTIGGRKIIIAGHGYYDSNYGHWLVRKYPWIWFKFMKKIHGQKIRFSFCKIRESNKGLIILSFDEKSFFLEDFVVEYNVDDKIPKRYRIVGNSREIRSNIIVEVKDIDIMPVRIFKFFPFFDTHLNLLKCEFDVKLERKCNKIRFKTKGVGEYLTPVY